MQSRHAEYTDDARPFSRP